MVKMAVRKKNCANLVSQTEPVENQVIRQCPLAPLSFFRIIFLFLFLHLNDGRHKKSCVKYECVLSCLYNSHILANFIVTTYWKYFHFILTRFRDALSR